MMVGVDDLVDLFKGDHDSLGYAHAELIIELCSRTSKDSLPTVDWVWGVVFPGKGRSEVDTDVQKIIVEGVKLWYRRGCPRHLGQ